MNIFSGKRLYIAAAVAGFLMGGLVFALKTPNPDTACRASTASNALQALAKGEVAAFTVFKTPRKLPGFSYQNAQGARVNISSLEEKTFLLNFWATWCIPCREEMPALDRLQQKRGNDDFSVLAVSLDAGGLEKPRKFYRDIEIKHLLLAHDADGTVFQAFRKKGLVLGLPTSLLVKDGCILGALAGPANWAGEDALKWIDAAMTPKL